MRWDGHSGGVLLRFGGLFLRDLLKVGRERESSGKRHGGMAFCRTCYCTQIT